MAAARSPASITLKSQLCRISTTADKAVALGVILIELVTNATKYAYTAGTGEVRVVLDATEDRFLRCFR